MGEEKLVNVEPVVLAIVVGMGMLCLFIPRRYAAIPFLVTSCYMTLGQVVVIAGSYFTMLRLMVLFGWIRLFVRKDLSHLRLNEIDFVFMAWLAANAIAYILLRETLEAVINRGGLVFDALGLYLFFRCVIRDYEDVKFNIGACAILIIPFAMLLLVEFSTGRNMFSVFGGVAEITPDRDGLVRCRGPFISSITAGTLGATLLPLFVPLALERGAARVISIAGMVAATTITAVSVSSGPITTYLFGLIGLGVWPLRRHMKMVCLGSFVGLLCMHVLMEAPVWHTMARLSDLIGGHGWYRASVMDKAIMYFDEWWLLGIEYTLHWGLQPLLNYPGQTDITSQYVGQGVQGGIFTVILFISIIVLCFRAVGLLVHASEGEETKKGLLFWSLGAVLFAHVMTFLSVAYFDQILVFWYLLLAMISSLSRAYESEP